MVENHFLAHVCGITMSEDFDEAKEWEDLEGEDLPSEEFDSDEMKHKVWIVYDKKIHGVFKNDTKAEKLRRKYSCKKSLFTIS